MDVHAKDVLRALLDRLRGALAVTRSAAFSDKAPATRTMSEEDALLLRHLFPAYVEVALAAVDQKRVRLLQTKKTARSVWKFTLDPVSTFLFLDPSYCSCESFTDTLVTHQVCAAAPRPSCF